MNEKQDDKPRDVAIQTGKPGDVLQQETKAKADDQSKHWQQLHVGEPYETLQARVKAEAESKTQAKPEDQEKERAENEALDDDKEVGQSKWAEDGGRSLDDGAGENTPTDQEPKEEPEQEKSSSESNDPNVQALETLPDDQLKKLAADHNVKIGANWKRTTIIMKLHDSGVRGPKVPKSE